jgi:phage tail tape-measure protein
MPTRYWNPQTGRYEDRPPYAPMSGPAQAAISATNAANAAGGGGGGIVGGALGGAAAGASIGSVVPGIGTIIGTGIGGLAGAIGSGIQGAKEQERYEEGMALKTRQQEEEEKQNKFMRGYYGRQQGMAGISQLANMRTMAMQNFKGQMFKDDLIRAITGR